MRLKALLAGTVSSIALVMGAGAQAQNQDNDNNDGVVDTIVVTGIRGSLASSLQSKRNADSIIEAITAEDIGKFPDKNVAEALQRLTGVSINREFGEGERVSIRGTDTNLTRTLLNGHAVGTADWFILDQLEASRSFNFLMLPSEIVSRLEVYKSPQADIDEGGIGGTIIVRTLKPLDGDEFSISGSAGGAYAQLADKITPQGSLLLNWHDADGTVGFNIAGIWQERELRRDGIEVLGYDTFFPNATNPGLPAEGLIVPNTIGSVLFRQKRVRKGINGAFQWAPNEQFEINLTGLYSAMSADNFNNGYFAAPGRKSGIFTPGVIQNGAALSGSIPTGQGGFSLIYDGIAREASTHTSSFDAELFYRPNDLWEFHLQSGYTEAKGATDRQFIWETLASGPGIDYDLTGGIPKVSFVGLDPTDPNDPTVLAEVGWAGGGWEITNNDDEFYMFADGERQIENAGVFKAIKAGLKYTDHGRNTNQIDQQRRSLFSWSGPAATGCDANGVSQTFDSSAALAASGLSRCGLSQVNMGFTPDNFLKNIAVPGVVDRFLEVDPDKILAISNAIPAVDQTVPGTTGAGAPPPFAQNVNVFNPGGSFNIKEETLGGYVMTDLEGEGWRGNFGVRVVHTKVTVDGWQAGLSAGDPGTVSDNFGVDPINGGGFFAPINEVAKYTDFLPSMNFAYDVTEDFLVRIAAARTMTRPNYNQLVPSLSTNPTLFTAVGGGNADLDPFRANQFDLSFEYYYSDTSAFNVGLFYKDLQSVVAITDEVERIRSIPALDNMGTPGDVSDDVFILNPDCTLVSGTFPNQFYDCNFLVSRPRNVGGATIKGFEVAWQHAFENGFGALFNYTYTDAKQDDGLPMPGASKHLFNATGFYENDWLSARLSYTHRTDFFIKIDRANPLSQSDTKSLDASITARFMEHYSVSLEAVNLTNALLKQYSVFKERPRAIYDNGRIFYLTARATF